MFNRPQNKKKEQARRDARPLHSSNSKQRCLATPLLMQRRGCVAAAAVNGALVSIALARRHVTGAVPSSNGGATFELFYDGGCPLCIKEIALLRRWDAAGGRVRWTDMSSSDFAPPMPGVTRNDMMARIHGRWLVDQRPKVATEIAGGAVVVGVPCIVAMYRTVAGFVDGPVGVAAPPAPPRLATAAACVVTVASWPWILPFTRRAYEWWALRRLRNRMACSAGTGACKRP